MQHNLQVRRLHNLHDMILDDLSFKLRVSAIKANKRG